VSASFPATRRQQDLLRFIVGYQRAHGGASPGFAEMTDGLGLVSKARVFEMLNGLQERGHVRRRPFKHRSIEVLTSIPVPSAPDGAPLYAVNLPEFSA
jgi:SOS-response transcriptional repressor LexA